ncbi:MAG: TetR/AcrR family transcriptional regulator C-terminal domain-containing protein [Oscillospiraceae bacterium]|nr:TetR/AcrR family transcriptional regulator C-terminal domain-containing protein [Oscillospiraceae bacterium]
MYRKCTTEISVRHQKQVEQALLELMQKFSYEDITVTLLCAEAGITRRIFYHLFNNKADALYAMIDHCILEVESYRLDVTDPIVRFFRYWKDHRRLMDVLQENNFSGLLLERIIDRVMQEDYDFRYWLRLCGWKNERDIIVFTISGIMGLTFRWYYGGFRESPEEMAQLLEKIIVNPIAGLPAG